MGRASRQRAAGLFGGGALDGQTADDQDHRGAAGGATALQAAPRDRFLGVWKLIRCERKFTDGRIGYPCGEKPDGRIMYDKAGRMAAQLMGPGRRSTVAPSTSFVTGNASAEEIREAVEGLIASYLRCGRVHADRDPSRASLPGVELGGYGLEAHLPVRRQPPGADGGRYHGDSRVGLGAGGGLSEMV
jgi:hypothetical protein